MSTVPFGGVYVEVPPTLLPLNVAVASSCALASEPPTVATAGDQTIVGVAGFTTKVTFAVAVAKSVVSFGVKVTEIVWLPPDSSTPAAGEYVNVPATGEPPEEAVASSCVALKSVP